jgi:hypothetical protein
MLHIQGYRVECLAGDDFDRQGVRNARPRCEQGFAGFQSRCQLHGELSLIGDRIFTRKYP